MLAKVEQKRKRNNILDKTFYYYTKYRKFGKSACSSHTIEERTVHEVVLADIQKHAGQALTDSKSMVTEIASVLISNCQRTGSSYLPLSSLRSR